MSEASKNEFVNPYELVSPGVYLRKADGAFFARPRIHGRNTWRKLRARNQKAAIKENANTDWLTPSDSFSTLADLYTKFHCPNGKLEPRLEEFCKPERFRVKMLKQFFGNTKASSIRIKDLPRYHAWRTKPSNLRFGSGNRTTDKDLVTLSNILTYGVAIGALEFNYVARGRPRYQVESSIRHSRDIAPASADTIHNIAAWFLESPRSEVLGWMAFFAKFTGCRTSELLRLRMDAESEQAGWIEGNMLFLGRRSKKGVNPWAMIGPEFSEMITAFKEWHRARFPKHPFFFPSTWGKRPVNAGSFGHGLTRACKHFKLEHITPHGFRSFYVTKRRSDGAPDVQIAGEIGDKTVILMQSTYGARPDNWKGGKIMTWLPELQMPAWNKWLPAMLKLLKSNLEKVDYQIDYAKNEPRKNSPEVIGRVVAGEGIEPPTQGFSVLCSTD